MQEYVKYLKNVLGVSQILGLGESAPPAVVVTQETTALSNSKITVWVESFNQFTAEDHTLLNNMLAAMKIPEGDMVVQDYSLKGSSKSLIEFDLVLNPDASGNQTYSPQVLHTNKNLKSVVWTFLQQIMQKHKSLANN